MREDERNRTPRWFLSLGGDLAACCGTEAQVRFLHSSGEPAVFCRLSAAKLGLSAGLPAEEPSGLWRSLGLPGEVALDAFPATDTEGARTPRARTRRSLPSKGREGAFGAASDAMPASRMRISLLPAEPTGTSPGWCMSVCLALSHDPRPPSLQHPHSCHASCPPWPRPFQVSPSPAGRGRGSRVDAKGQSRFSLSSPWASLLG